MRIERHVLFWLAAAILLLAAIAMLREVLLPFVAGVVLAYVLNPIADGLERMGFNRKLAAALILLLGAAVIATALVLLVPLIANQVRALAATSPDDIARAKATLDAWLQAKLGSRFSMVQQGVDRALLELSQNWSMILSTVAAALWRQGMALINIVSLLLVTPVVMFYLLVDWHPMLAKIDRWLPREHEPQIRRLAGEVNTAIAAFFRGQGTICLLLGAFYAIALTFVGVPYGLLIGLATGALAFIPYVGWALGLIASLAMTLVQAPHDTLALAKVAGIFAAGMALDSAVLAPLIVGAKIGLHPVWLMFALFVFGYLFGFVGLLVAVPVAAGIAVLVRFGLERYLASSIYTGGMPDASKGDRP